jgi:hypothetical protein
MATLAPNTIFGSRASYARSIAVAAIWAAIGTSRAADTPAPSPEKLDRITEFFNNEIASGKLPGAVVLIQPHGKPLYL